MCCFINLKQDGQWRKAILSITNHYAKRDSTVSYLLTRKWKKRKQGKLDNPVSETKDNNVENFDLYVDLSNLPFKSDTVR